MEIKKTESTTRSLFVALAVIVIGVGSGILINIATAVPV